MNAYQGEKETKKHGTTEVSGEFNIIMMFAKNIKSAEKLN